MVIVDETKAQKIVISLGGSIFVPQDIDTGFITGFKQALLRAMIPGRQFFVIVGGGSISRKYQNAGRELRELSIEDIDWIGIHATRLNAEFMRRVFMPGAYDGIILDPKEAVGLTETVIFGAGWKPGRSSDFVAVDTAIALGADIVVNLSNIDYVYDKDPRNDPSAKKLEKIGWKDYRALIPAEWDPGLSTPFDPIASKEAESHGLAVAVMNGRKLDNFENFLRGKPFEGTLISDTL